MTPGPVSGLAVAVGVLAGHPRCLRLVCRRVLLAFSGGLGVLGMLSYSVVRVWMHVLLPSQRCGPFRPGSRVPLLQIKHEGAWS